MFKYYLNIIRPQLLHKLNTKNIPEIKQIAFNIYLDSENEKYIICLSFHDNSPFFCAKQSIF